MTGVFILTSKATGEKYIMTKATLDKVLTRIPREQLEEKVIIKEVAEFENKEAVPW